MLKKLVLIIFCLSLIVVAPGCAMERRTEPGQPKEPKTNPVMNDFRILTQKDFSVEEVANFIKNNISSVSKEEASSLVDEFEKIQKKNLPQFESMFASDDVQSRINKEYKSIVAQSDIKDTRVKELLAVTRNSGYKVETAEGFFFPIIDYGFYKNFSTHVTPDMKDYIDIMAVESGNVPAKDAALVISWDEVLKRALNQEKFINMHKDSIKISEIKQLYKKYVTITFYGLNNTPLFSYDTKTLNPKAKDIYSKAVENAGSSKFLKSLDGFLDLVKNNNSKLTEEVEQYRENIIKQLD